MTPADLQTYLHAHIPLSAAMGVAVLQADERGMQLAAPLAPNINHRETVFGGSASAVAILAAWSHLSWHLTRQGMPVRLVIQRNSMEYLLPVSGDFLARTAPLDVTVWARFVRTLERHGRARIEMPSELVYEGATAGRFSGEFVALR